MMNEEPYTFLYENNPPESELAVLRNGLDAHAKEAKGMAPLSTYGVFIKNSAGKTVGGINVFTYFGHLFIDMLWVEESLRHLGYGQRLMEKAEQISKERGCTFAVVNTMDFEALPFYQKLGYQIEFTRTGFENNSVMYLLRKNYTPNSSSN